MSERSRADSRRREAAKPAAPDAAPSDAECVLLARDGIGRGLTLLVHRHTPGIFGLLARLLQDRHLAEDATQEVFLRMHRSLSGFDTHRNFRAWLYAIAWNYGRDLLRQKRRRGRILQLGASLPGKGGHEDPAREDAPADPHDVRARSPSDLAALDEERDLVRRALGEIDPSNRALLVLREYENLSYDEIAEILKWRIGTVKSRLHRARLQLRDALARLSPELFAQERDEPPTQDSERRFR